MARKLLKEQLKELKALQNEHVKEQVDNLSLCVCVCFLFDCTKVRISLLHVQEFEQLQQQSRELQKVPRSEFCFFC
jgi:hypothetical protein